MPEIKFPTEWLKIGDNTQDGDNIQFLDAGEQDEDGRWTFNVAVLRNGDVVEFSKKFNLNKGNFKEVSALYGSNSDLWINKEMKVVKIKARNPQTNSLVDSIALEAPAPKPAPSAPTTPPPVQIA